MPNYDLSSALEGRVAGQPVDMLRIANQIVWEASAPPAELFTVWDEAPITLSSHNDAGTGAYIAQQFARYAGDPLEITDIGIYVPAGSSLIGQSAKVSAQFSATPMFDPGVANTMPANETSGQVLVSGWNWVPFPSPLEWTESLPYILAGYNVGLGPYYLYNDVVPTTTIVSPAGFHELVAWHSAGTHRSWYSGFAGANFAHSNAGSYGLDVRIRHQT
jgi:hypothetical protein